jgi:predicted PurR-regulated permease PerM
MPPMTGSASDLPRPYGGAAGDSPDVGAAPGTPLPAAVPVVGTLADLPAAIVPDWLVNLAALGWRLLAIAALLVVLWMLCTLLWTVTAAIAVAVVVSAVFAPVVLRLRGRGRSRTAAAAIVWVIALLVIIGVSLLLAIAFLPYLADATAAIQQGVAALQAQLAELQAPPWVASAIGTVIESMRTASGDAGGGVVSAAAEWVTVAILAAFLVFFFLRDGDRAWFWTFQDLDERKRERITTAGEDALARVGGYLRGTTVLSAVIALTDLAFMLVLGVPMAGPLALLVFLSGYIPYFGGIVTTAIILLVTYGALGPAAVVVMIVLIAIRNAILGYGVRPAVYGRTVNIHPALVLIALPAGMQLAGIIGLFAAVPVVAVILAVSRAVVAIVTPDEEPALPGLVPAWLDRVAQWSWRLLVGIALVAAIVQVFVAVPLVLIPLVLATILDAALDPLVRWLIRRGRSRGQAAAISVGGGFLAIAVVLLLAFGVLVQYAAETGAAVTAGAVSADTASGGVLGVLANGVAQLGVSGVRTILSVADSAATLAIIILLSALLAFYFVRDGAQLWERVAGAAQADAAAELRQAGHRAFEVLGGYMFGTAVISLVGASSQFVIMVLLGIPLALPVFVLSFFLCFIPYIGGFISTGVALLLTIATGSPTAIAVMVIWTLVFNIVTGNVVSPLVYGRTVHLHPAVVLVAIPAGGAIAGVLGMFLVVPAIGVVAAVWRTVLAVMGVRRRAVNEAAAAAGAARALNPPPHEPGGVAPATG